MVKITSRLQRQGFMFVLSSPSGAGKTTISRLLLQNDSNLVMSISCTTRPRRDGEIDSVDYYFINQAEFEQRIAKGDFLECANVFGHHYGTPKELVEQSLNAGKDVLFDIDWQGTHQLTQNARDNIVSVFILPPSMKELEERLRNRNLDSDEVIAKRMDKASHEINHWYGYDYVIVNYDRDESAEKVKAILQAERLRRTRQNSLNPFVEGLLKEAAGTSYEY